MLGPFHLTARGVAALALVISFSMMLVNQKDSKVLDCKFYATEEEFGAPGHIQPVLDPSVTTTTTTTVTNNARKRREHATGVTAGAHVAANGADGSDALNHRGADEYIKNNWIDCPTTGLFSKNTAVIKKNYTVYANLPYLRIDDGNSSVLEIDYIDIESSTFVKDFEFLELDGMTGLFNASQISGGCRDKLTHIKRTYNMFWATVTISLLIILMSSLVLVGINVTDQRKPMLQSVVFMMSLLSDALILATSIMYVIRAQSFHSDGELFDDDCIFGKQWFPRAHEVNETAIALAGAPFEAVCTESRDAEDYTEPGALVATVFAAISCLYTLLWAVTKYMNNIQVYKTMSGASMLYKSGLQDAVSQQMTAYAAMFEN